MMLVFCGLIEVKFILQHQSTEIIKATSEYFVIHEYFAMYL